MAGVNLGRNAIEVDDIAKLDPLTATSFEYASGLDKTLTLDSHCPTMIVQGKTTIV